MHKYGLKAFGVSLMAVLGLMAMFAVAAQAENLSDGGKAGKFKVEGSSALVIGAKFVGVQEGAGKLLIAAKNAFVECKKGKVTSGEGVSESEVKAVVLFEECATFEDKSPFNALTACNVIGEPASTGKVEAKGVGKAILHEGKLYVLLSGAPFATIKFGPECGIGVKVEVKGSVVAEVDNGEEKLTHLLTFSEAIQKLFQVGGVGDKLLYGASEAFINASATVELTEKHAGKVWSVV